MYNIKKQIVINASFESLVYKKIITFSKGDNLNIILSLSDTGLLPNFILESDSTADLYYRVIAKPLYKDGIKSNDTPLFTLEQKAQLTKFNDESTTIYQDVFDVPSSFTSGSSGAYAISFILYNKSDDTITTVQIVKAQILDNGYNGLYLPTEDFRDEVLEAQVKAEEASNIAQTASSIAVEAKEEVTKNTEEVRNILASCESAQDICIDSANSALQTVGLRQIQITTSSIGRFFFNGGTFQATQKQALGTTFSICRTLKIKWEDWETLADYRYFDGNNLGWGSNSTIGWGFAVISHRLFFYYRAIEDSVTILDLSTAQTESIMDGNTHTLIVIGANNTILLYVDGLLIKSKTVTGGIIDIPTPSATQTIRQITGEYSRIKQFNFDMSSDDAPYTIEDYCKGIEEPPSLHNPTAEYHTDYSYSDFIFDAEVLDYSGNNNHATISGNIAGDKDNKIELLYQKIATRIENNN